MLTTTDTASVPNTTGDPWLAFADKPRLCRDCRFAKVSWTDWFILGGYTFAKCSHPSAVRASGIEGRYALVDGKPRPMERMTPCVVQRGFECGESAKFWEPRAAAGGDK